MDRLKEIMKVLRSENGCPWDKEQNHKSLIPCLLEEAYEVVEAIESEDDVGLKEELGDLLFQSVFHAQLAEEEGKYNLYQVIDGISEKLIRRHPHVFARVDGIDSADKVITQWEKIKESEKKSKPKGDSILDSVTVSLPAIQKAEKIQSKVAKVGFDWEKWQEPIEKLWEEVDELKEELNQLKTFHSNEGKIKSGEIPKELKERIESEMGDVLFSIINVSRHLDLSAESALRKTNEKFSSRFRHIEREAKNSGKNLLNMTLEEMDELWNQAKQKE
ncbi:MAG: nucleoside triphosphate pyrophosphohydrolase [Leptospira sp.]|nr:nucleoside triphosphate pyrophosphohydrolase [Leptospira sp.]